MHFNLIRMELRCSPVVFGHNKTVANTISPLSFLWCRITLPFSFPPLLLFGPEQKFLLILVGSCGRAVKHSASIECSFQLFVVDQICSLSWAGIQLQDRCFTVLFIGFATQRVGLHIDREQVACRKKKKKPTPCFCIFLMVYRFLSHTDCSWMCKKAGLEVSMRDAIPYRSDANADAPGLVFSPELGDAHTMAHGQAWPGHNLLSHTVTSYSS